MWTDEATNELNRHSSIYWSLENPHEIISQELIVPGGGIWYGGIIGLYFFENSYLNVLREAVIAELQNIPLLGCNFC